MRFFYILSAFGAGIPVVFGVAVNSFLYVLTLVEFALYAAIKAAD